MSVTDTVTIPDPEPSAAATAVGEYPPRTGGERMFRYGLGVLVAVAAVYAPFYFTAERNLLLSQALYLAVAAMGLNLLTGFNGQISLGHGAFFGVGAFTTAQLMVNEGWMFEATLPVAALLSGLLGMAVAFPALRVRGLYLALVTLGLAIVFPQVADKYIKGQGGRAFVQPRLREFDSLLSGLENDQWKYFVCLTVLAVLALLSWNLMRSRTGRAMIATRDHELAASTVGVNLAATKVGTFAISAAYAGLAGSLSVMIDGFADATNPIVYFRISIEFLVAAVIGGVATVTGPIVGAFLLVAVRRNSDQLSEDETILAPAILGGALILITYVMPDGVVGGVSRLARRVRGFLGRRTTTRQQT